jgi:hypothetical protein
LRQPTHPHHPKEDNTTSQCIYLQILIDIQIKERNEEKGKRQQTILGWTQKQHLQQIQEQEQQ